MEGGGDGGKRGEKGKRGKGEIENKCVDACVSELGRKKGRKKMKHNN